VAVATRIGADRAHRLDPLRWPLGRRGLLPRVAAVAALLLAALALLDPDAGTVLRPHRLGYLGPGNTSLTLKNTTGETARMILLGGAPFEEEIVMWWNFVARSHDEILQAREEWQRSADRFGSVEGYDGDRLPAPAAPITTLRPRRNPRRP
jgi:hypothetical protein